MTGPPETSGLGLSLGPPGTIGPPESTVVDGVPVLKVPVGKRIAVS